MACSISTRRLTAFILFLGDGNASGELTVPIVDLLLQIRGAANIRFENVAFDKDGRYGRNRGKTREILSSIHVSSGTQVWTEL